MLNGAKLTGCNFAGAALANGSFRLADISGCDFTRASFRGSDLSGANLVNCSFRRADLRDVKLDVAEIYDLDGLRTGHFKKVNIAGSTLDGANLKGASVDPDLVMTHRRQRGYCEFTRQRSI